MTFGDATAWWTAEREQILRRMWDEGVTTKVIAYELGTTKNAVIGKANRLHLVPRAVVVPRHKSGKWA